MASRATAEKWLHELTHIPTASGLEHEVVAWITKWVARRSDLKLTVDSGGNLLITQKGRKRLPLLLAVAHMDHPAFVVTDADTDRPGFEFRGGVDEAYFHRAGVNFARTGGVWAVDTYDPETSRGTLKRTRRRTPDLRKGDIGIWEFATDRGAGGLFQAPACDDLAGVAAALAALDIARKQPGMKHFGLLLTRAEEVGLVGALHAARNGTIPPDSRVISIETSRELPTAPIGAGPIIRTGDRATVFDREMTNRISLAAAASGLKHQRKLMDGGGCEATAFGGFGYRAAGLCVALRNWHNRGNLDAVQSGKGSPVPMLEAISLDDFHGLTDLILIAVRAIDEPDSTRDRLESLYQSRAWVLKEGPDSSN